MILYIGMKKTIKLLLLVLMMALIFFFSSQVADDSTVTTNIVIELLYKIYSFFVSKTVDLQTFTNLVFNPVRKLAHFSEFGLFGIIVYLNIKEYKTKNIVIYSIIFSCLYAISDEIHQIFVPGRACTLIDVLIDTCGASLGIILIHLILKRWIKN